MKRDGAEHFDNRFRQFRCVSQQRLKIGQLFLIGQVASQEQKGDFGKRGVTGQVFNGITAVLQPLFNRRDGGFSRNNAFQTREIPFVVHENPLDQKL